MVLRSYDSEPERTTMETMETSWKMFEKMLSSIVSSINASTEPTTAMFMPVRQTRYPCSKCVCGADVFVIHSATQFKIKTRF